MSIFKFRMRDRDVIASPYVVGDLVRLNCNPFVVKPPYPAKCSKNAESNDLYFSF